MSGIGVRYSSHDVPHVFDNNVSSILGETQSMAQLVFRIKLLSKIVMCLSFVKLQIPK